MTIPIGTPVRVYWNFHRKLFSVQVKGEKGWRVAGRVRSLRLENVTFHVSQAGRERVLRERKKNVHAKVHGIVCRNSQPYSEEFFISYNPYYLNGFYAHKKQIEKTTNVVRSCQSATLYEHQGHPRIVGRGVK